MMIIGTSSSSSIYSILLLNCMVYNKLFSIIVYKYVDATTTTTTTGAVLCCAVQYYD